jgi:circadian clock protein KaiC
LIAAGSRRDANTMLIRLIDFLKLGGITAFLTNLTSGGAALESTEVEISSLVDTWLLNRDIELGGERNRAMYVLKSRGMSHSNQLREFLLTDQGFELLDAYVGPEGTLTGSSRLSQEAGAKATTLARQQEASERERGRKRKRDAFEARIIALRTEFEAEGEQAERLATQAVARDKVAENREVMGRRRHADVGKASAGSRKIPRSGNEKLGKARPAATS